MKRKGGCEIIAAALYLFERIKAEDIGMIVRKIRPEELKRTKELFAAAFDVSYDNDKTPEEVYEAACRSPRGREDARPLEKYAAFEDDDRTMTSCISVLHYPVQFDGSHVEMAGVGEVSSLPQYRRKGGVRACFEALLPDLYHEGVVFSCLYPFSTSYYRKFGYEMNAQSCIYEWKLAHIPQWNTKGHCMLVDSENALRLLPDVQRIYGVWQERYNFMVCNEEWEYCFVTEANPYKTLEYTYVYYGNDGIPAGFVTFHKEIADGERILAATKLVFADPMGFQGLFSLIKGFASDYSAVRFSLPEELEIEPFLGELSFDACRRSRRNIGMVRIVNVERALMLARYKGSGELCIDVRDGQIEENDGMFHITFENGRAARVKKLRENSGEQPDLTLPVSEFSRLLAGAYKTETLPFCNVSLRDGAGWDEETLASIGQIFYKKPCWLMEGF